MHQLKSRSVILVLLSLFFAASLVPTRSALGEDPRQEGYPPPGGATAESLLPAEVPLQPSPNAYPPAGSGIDGATPAPIGSQINQEGTSGNTVEGNQSSQQDAGRGLLFVWLGCFATLLVFLTSVIGSIVLFTRRNES